METLYQRKQTLAHFDLAEPIALAVEKGDKPRLQRLILALTKNKKISHYAEMPDSDATNNVALATDALKVIAKKDKEYRDWKKSQKQPEPVAKPEQPSICLRQLSIFDDEQRWPRRPYCSDDLQTGLKIRSLKQALTKQYVQANPPNLRVWSIHDVDRAGAAGTWESAGLPPPSWATINKANGHAHLVWGLTAPVLVEDYGGRKEPMRYLCGIEAFMREKLQADAGYSGLITKNPAHPLWDLLVGPVPHYSLKELADSLPGLNKHLPKTHKNIEQIGLGRNCTLFDYLRKYAYKAVRNHENFVMWQSHLNNQALTRNGDFAAPLEGNEVWHIAKSVAKWVWYKFDLQASDDKFSKLQAFRGAKGGLAKGLANEDKRSSAILMRAKGMTQQEIADELEVSQKTVSNWLRNS